MNAEKPNTNQYFLLNITYKTENQNTADSSENSIKKANTEYFVHLIHTALADDVISPDELKLLQQISKKLGFTVAETDHLVRTTVGSDHNPPTELLSRFEQVFEIVNMTLADGSFDKNEMRLASGFAAKCGFNETEIPAMLVLLANGIRQGKNKTELFKEYQNKLKS